MSFGYRPIEEKVALINRTRGWDSDMRLLRMGCSCGRWCRRRDSNSRPEVYKTPALPTELLRHLWGRVYNEIIDFANKNSQIRFFQYSIGRFCINFHLGFIEFIFASTLVIQMLFGKSPKAFVMAPKSVRCT